MKHTPGPWEVSDMAANVYGATGDVVASIHGLPKPHLTGERKANAYLIATAPELLVAVKMMEEAITAWQYTGKPNLGVIGTAQDAARAAIAKAEGRTS